MITLHNENWNLQIGECGAELQSWKEKESGTEYIWQGDPKIWSGHAPLLFPIVGRQKDDLCDYGDGTEYPMKSHGFARNQVFRVTESASDRVRMVLRDNEETRKCYPFFFELISDYRLTGDTLTVCRTVRNLSECELPFLLGEHFGFCVPLSQGECYTDYFVEFEKSESAPCWPLNADHYMDRPQPYLHHQTQLELDPHMFDGDARIFTSFQSRSVCLRSRKGTRGVRVEFPSHTSLGLWAKPCAPYLCIEPWTGHDSYAGDSHLFSEKEDVIKLAPGQERSLECKITLFR